MASHPVDTGAPHTDSHNPAVRATGMCWDTNRYNATARTLGPYAVGAFASAGNAALVVAPQSQRTRWARCSVTSNRRVGRSKT